MTADLVYLANVSNASPNKTIYLNFHQKKFHILAQSPSPILTKKPTLVHKKIKFLTKIVSYNVFAISAVVSHWGNPCEANTTASYQEN